MRRWRDKRAVRRFLRLYPYSDCMCGPIYDDGYHSCIRCRILSIERQHR